MSSDGRMNAKRASRIAEVAQELCDREGARAQAEGILEAPDLVSVFALACAMSVVRFKDLSDELATDLAGTALRTIIKNLMVQRVDIPDL